MQSSDLLKTSVLVSLMALVVSAYGQYPGYSKMPDQSSFRVQFKELSGKINTIESSFSQEKVLTALEEKIVSTGSFWFKREDKVRIEYQRPFVYLLIMNGDKLYMKDADKESQLNVRSNKLFQQVNKIMLDCVRGTILESKDFNATAFQDSDTYLVALTPSSKLLADFFESIVVVVEKGNGAVRSIQMNEPGGDYTRMLFSDKKINQSIADEVFVP